MTKPTPLSIEMYDYSSVLKYYNPDEKLRKAVWSYFCSFDLYNGSLQWFYKDDLEYDAYELKELDKDVCDFLIRVIEEFGTDKEICFYVSW